MFEAERNEIVAVEVVLGKKLLGDGREELLFVAFEHGDQRIAKKLEEDGIILLKGTTDELAGNPIACVRIGRNTKYTAKFGSRGVNVVDGAFIIETNRLLEELHNKGYLCKTCPVERGANISKKFFTLELSSSQRYWSGPKVANSSSMCEAPNSMEWLSKELEDFGVGESPKAGAIKSRKRPAGDSGFDEHSRLSNEIQFSSGEDGPSTSQAAKRLRKQDSGIAITGFESSDSSLEDNRDIYSAGLEVDE